MTEDTLGPGWEAVTVDFCGVPTLRRIEVPGGWLYLAGILGEGATLCFVPTPHPPTFTYPDRDEDWPKQEPSCAPTQQRAAP